MTALQATIVDGAHKATLKNVPKPSVGKKDHTVVKVIAAAANPPGAMNSRDNRIFSARADSAVVRTCDK
jgi:hypothetical protein